MKTYATYSIDRRKELEERARELGVTSEKLEAAERVAAAFTDTTYRLDELSYLQLEAAYQSMRRGNREPSLMAVSPRTLSEFKKLLRTRQRFGVVPVSHNMAISLRFNNATIISDPSVPELTIVFRA